VGVGVGVGGTMEGGEDREKGIEEGREGRYGNLMVNVVNLGTSGSSGPRH